MPTKVIYSRTDLLGNIERLRERLSFAKLHFALKACAELPVLAVMAEAGLSFEVASAEEFDLLLGLQVRADNIICGLPVKGPLLIRRLYRAGCRCFVFDCIEEFESLQREAPEAAKILRIQVSDLDNESPQWGMDWKAFEHCQETVPKFSDSIDGITFHLARNYRLVTINKALDRTEAWLNKIDNGSRRQLNIGGGYRGELPKHLTVKHDLNAFYAAFSRRIECMREKFSLDIYAEPGRAVVESAGRLQTAAMQVRSRSQNEVEIVLELNIGVRPGAHPTQIAVVSGSHREVIYDLDLHLRPESKSQVMYNFVDATCEYGVFYRLPLRRPVRPMEILEFSGLGAYTTCLSSRFHGRAHPSVRVC